MDRPKGSELQQVPDALRGISAAGPIQVLHPGALPARLGQYREPSGVIALGPTDARRLLRVLNAELRKGPAGYVRPDWPQPETAIPGLTFAIHYFGRDAHGITQQLRGLDLAFRRAAATLQAVADGERLQAWRPALRPERGGLWIGDSRTGSWECAGTVYGEFVSVAYSTPIALAALASLAWQGKLAASHFVYWMVRRLPGRMLGEQPHVPEEPERAPQPIVEWGIGTTKALGDVMLEAVKNGQGLEFESETASTRISLRVYPRSELRQTDEV